MSIYRGSRKYDKIESVDKIYCIDIGSMRGGYTISQGKKTNVHDPERYKNIKITWFGIGEKNFSINDVTNLPSKLVDDIRIYLLNKEMFLKQTD